MLGGKKNKKNCSQDTCAMVARVCLVFIKTSTQNLPLPSHPTAWTPISSCAYRHTM